MASAGGTFIYLPPTGGGSSYWGDAVATFASLPLTGTVVGEAVLVLDTLTIYAWDGATWTPIVNGPSDVSGPAGAVDGQLVLFDGASGKIIKAGTGTGYVKATAGVASFQAVPIPVADGGTNSTTALNNNRVVQTSGGKIQEAAAITASRALASDTNGIPVAATTTATELGYVNGVTSAIQTQLNAKEPTITVLPISKGGTNSGAALNNNRIIQSSGGAVVEAAAITASRALASDVNGIPVASATTAAELGFVSGVTSAIQTQINTKVTGAGSSTDEAVARFDGTTGKIIQNSTVTISDTGQTTINNSVAADKVLLVKGASGQSGSLQEWQDSSGNPFLTLAAGGGLTFNGTTGYLRLPNLTTAQRNLLTAAPGYVVFDTDFNKPYCYVATDGWLPMIGWGN